LCAWIRVLLYDFCINQRDFFIIREAYVMSDTNETSNAIPVELPRKKTLTRRLLVAIPMAVVFIAIGAAVYLPGMFVGGMMTDSCSGNAYTMWNVWLVYLWPVVLLAAALFPPYLVIKNKPAKTVLLAMAAGLGASVAWYILWIPVMYIAGC
jgi:hypothetical protein